jgi:hypothetical protein
VQYPGNDAGNGATGGWIFDGTARSWKRLYMCMAIKFESPYVTHTNKEKLWYPLGTNGMNTLLEVQTVPTQDATTGEMRLFLDTQWGGGASNEEFAQASGPYIQKGAWQVIETYMVMNTPGSSDGVFQAWINGTPVMSHSTVGYSTADTVWTQPRWTGTRGGGASSVLTPSGGQRRWYDRVAAWGNPL